MPQVRIFNTAEREVFPPRPMNYDVGDPDAARLRIVLAPPGHFLLAEAQSQIATGVDTAPIVRGGVIPIVADDTPFVRLANGSLAQPLSDALVMPTFFGSDAFPEPIVEVVELDASADATGAVAMGSGPVDLTNEDEIRPPSRALTAVEMSALEDKVKQLEEQNHERFKASGVRTISPEEAERIVAAAHGREIKHDNPARSFVQPPPMIRKHQWINRRTNQLIAVTGIHAADAERQAELEWEDKHGR